MVKRGRPRTMESETMYKVFRFVSIHEEGVEKKVVLTNFPHSKRYLEICVKRMMEKGWLTKSGNKFEVIYKVTDNGVAHFNKIRLKSKPEFTISPSDIVDAIHEGDKSNPIRVKQLEEIMENKKIRREMMG